MQVVSQRITTRTKTTWESTETETETERICTTDTEAKQVITGPSNLLILNSHVEAQAQGIPERPSSPASESTSLSSETATFFVDNAAAPLMPTSSHSSDELWVQVEDLSDLSALVDRIELRDSSV
ncbi:uncharacterized protein F5891DRAFT_1195427 [Suillus fuscotomentosus]|uniref:Uncharacterized protein n=1 Tax=Suillus fuscotomentosus TaxID=1912939 RepID=A0AAD4DX91_9AGAM|nr:uncharacterized protein F5891DRAFT_1195427 [Suillus fuscotomentosus]KAG1894288.1 hypothetical protein F5891DRAFT_1195427 [Suillus fuscotomentosus]